MTNPFLAAIVASVASAGDPSPRADAAIAVPAGEVAGADGPVAVPAFRMDRAEVTVAEFERFVADGGYRRPELWSEAGRAWLARHPGGAGAELRAAGRPADHPVVAVTWYEADAFCRWAGGRLPTEAEWQRACGGARFPWGEREDERAAWWHGGKYGHLDRVRTVPAGASPLASPLGFVHLAGNVWEWTASDWAAEGVGAEPRPGTPWKVLRGGSFMNLPSYCTCTHREPARPDRVAFTTGFRCAYDASPSPSPSR